MHLKSHTTGNELALCTVATKPAGKSSTVSQTGKDDDKHKDLGSMLRE